MVRWLLIGLFVLLLPLTAHAQQTLPEDEFWQRLQQTRVDLGAALESRGEARADILREINAYWQGVGAVRVGDDTITIDTRWLQLPPDADEATIQTAANRITALERYSAAQGIPLDGLGLNEQEPEPPPPTPEIRVAPNPFIEVLAQGILISMGVMLVVGLLVMIARGLRGATVTQSTLTLEEDDPQTAADARDRAQSSEQVQDYRAAVRYLYLSSLLMLDERNLIRYDPSLTNQEHLVQVDDPLRSILAPIINFFDQTWYGFAPITQRDYERFQHQVAQLQQLAAAERQP